jgi:hypothetical protein
MKIRSNKNVSNKVQRKIKRKKEELYIGLDDLDQ